MLSGVGEGGVTHDCLPGFFTQATLSVAGSVKASEYYDADVLRPPFFPPPLKMYANGLPPFLEVTSSHLICLGGEQTVLLCFMLSLSQ